METIGSFEAKTHLPRFLERVAQGEEFTITKHGKPVARLLPPLAAKSVSDVRLAVEAMKKFRKGRTLGGLSIREIIDEGRRFWGEHGMEAADHFVLDGSVTMVWGFEDEADEYAEAINPEPTATAFTPSVSTVAVPPPADWLRVNRRLPPRIVAQGAMNLSNSLGQLLPLPT
jgi:prevent-host-death family protein